MKPKIGITLVERRGECACHRGHKVGDSFDFDTERGKLCPMACHVAFPYVDVMRYGREPPKAKNGEILFCCPHSDVMNVFKIERIPTEE